jgi:integrase
MTNEPISRNPNHPKKGSSIWVAPIRELEMIQEIKQLLYYSPLYSCIFTVGINTAFRAGDLLSFKVKQVRGLQPMDDFRLPEEKTKKGRRISLNEACITAINRLLATRDYQDCDYLFTGQRGKITVPTLSFYMKRWCRQAGLDKENYGSHTLRKTWAYHQYVTFKTPLAKICECLNHSSERQTMAYLGIQPQDIKEIYANTL